jgi:hypothetical protein
LEITVSEFREAFELIFKVPDDVFWDGNSYLPKGEQPYSFESMDRACHLDSVLEGYSTAQSELAALREELALIDSYWRPSVDQAEQRLTAAEQRNSELEKHAARYIWLRDKSESVHQFYLSTPIWFTGVKFNTENVDSTIDAAMAKPTESGASE